jgi:hypothetical protein
MDGNEMTNPRPRPLDDWTLIEILKALARGGMTQAAIAIRFGVVTQTINDISLGKHSRAAELKALLNEGKTLAPAVDWLTLQTPALNRYRKHHETAPLNQ